MSENKLDLIIYIQFKEVSFVIELISIQMKFEKKYNDG